VVARVLGLLAIAALIGMIAPPAARADGAYAFAKIVETTGPAGGFGCPAINQAGDIAYGGASAMFLKTATRTIRIADTSGPLDSLGTRPSLNDAGQVSFGASLDAGHEGFFRGGAGGLTLIARMARSIYRDASSINDGGTVAFRGELLNGDTGLFSWDGSGITVHYLVSTSPFAGISQDRPVINDDGHITFTADLDSGAYGVFVAQAGGGFTTITVRSGPGALLQPSMNAGGEVAFIAKGAPNTEQDVMVGSGGPLTTVATTAGDFYSFGFNGGPSINDQGQVAFTADLEAGGEGLFVGDDPVADRVIGTGDTLDGGTVATVDACAHALNDAGQLAFTVLLNDPGGGQRHAVFRADPTS
jgi:hypothetical protein